MHHVETVLAHSSRIEGPKSVEYPALPERASSDHFVRASLDQWSELAREIQQHYCKTQVGQEIMPSVDIKLANPKMWSKLARGVNPWPPRASSDQIWSELALGGPEMTQRASSDHFS